MCQQGGKNSAKEKRTREGESGRSTFGSKARLAGSSGQLIRERNERVNDVEKGVHSLNKGGAFGSPDGISAAADSLGVAVWVAWRPRQLNGECVYDGKRSPCVACPMITNCAGFGEQMHDRFFMLYGSFLTRVHTNIVLEANSPNIDMWRKSRSSEPNSTGRGQVSKLIRCRAPLARAPKDAALITVMMIALRINQLLC